MANLSSHKINFLQSNFAMQFCKFEERIIAWFVLILGRKVNYKKFKEKI